MSGTPLGYIKGKMGLKGKTKRGEMISQMNKMKRATAPAILSCKNCGSNHKTGDCTSLRCKTCGMNHTTGSCSKAKSNIGMKKYSSVI